MMNPWAQMREPMTIEDHQRSRFVVEPLHLLDCCLVSNGAIAVIMTSAERARDLRQPPVYGRGVGQGAPGDHVDVVALYDCEGGEFGSDGKLAPGGGAANQHRRRPAVVVLHVGRHAAARGGRPGQGPSAAVHAAVSPLVSSRTARGRRPVAGLECDVR
jgi:acetyl-CoA acetyltransferase